MNRNWGKIQINDKIGEKYLIKRKLVPGGGGPVYSGIDLKTKKVVQIRFFSGDEILDDISLRYRVEETEKVQEMCGDVVTIPVDYGFYKEIPYIVNKFGDIKTLHQVLTAGEMIGEKTAKPLVGTLLTMLGEIHDGGVVHLGLHPLSIYQRQSSMNLFVPGVLDFGLVPFRGHSYFSYPGSLDNVLNYISSYASPEQASYDEIVDHRADLFSVGVLIFRLILGETPFRGNSTEEILGKVVSETPSSLFDDSAMMSKNIRDFLFKALQKEPRDRFQSSSEMLESFLDSLGGEPMTGAGETKQAEVVEYDEDLPSAPVKISPVVMPPVKPIEPQEPSPGKEDKIAETGPPAAPKGAYGQVKLSSKPVRSALYKANPMQEEVLQAGKNEARAAAKKGADPHSTSPQAEKGEPGDAGAKPAEQAPANAQQVGKAPQHPPPPPAASKPRQVEPISVEAPPEHVMVVESTQEKAIPPDPSRQQAVPDQAAQAQAIPVSPPASDQDAALADAVDREMQQAAEYEPEEAAHHAVAAGDRGADLLAGLDGFDVEEEEQPAPAPALQQPPAAPSGAGPNAAAKQAKARGEREMEMEFQGAMEEVDLGMELMNAKSRNKGPKPRAKPRINPNVKKLLKKEKLDLPPSIAFERDDAPEEPKSLKDRFKGFMKNKK